MEMQTQRNVTAVEQLLAGLDTVAVVSQASIAPHAVNTSIHALVYGRESHAGNAEYLNLLDELSHLQQLTLNQHCYNVNGLVLALVTTAPLDVGFSVRFPLPTKDDYQAQIDNFDVGILSNLAPWSVWQRFVSIVGSCTANQSELSTVYSIVTRGLPGSVMDNDEVDELSLEACLLLTQHVC